MKSIAFIFCIFALNLHFDEEGKAVCPESKAQYLLKENKVNKI